MRHCRLVLLMGMFCFLVAPVRFASAQALADRVPDDSIVYIGWSGTDAMGADFQTSHFKAILDASDIPKIVTDFIPKIFEKIGEEEPDAKEAGQLIKAIVLPMWKHPTAVYFQGVEFSRRGDAMPKIEIVCNAGEDAAGLMEQVKGALDKAGPTPMPLDVTESKGVVRFSIGHVSDTAAHLDSSPAFKAALTKVHAKPVAVVYVNGDALMNLIGQSVAQSHRPDAAKHWTDLQKALGLNGFKSGIWSVAFIDKNWETRGFIAAPAPRTGLLKMADGPAISDETLKRIPESAVIAGVGRFDLLALFDGVKSGIETVSPKDIKNFDNGVQMVNGMAGVDVRNDLLATIGDTWTYYVDPATGGNGVLGTVVLNKLRDPVKAEASFTKVEQSVNQFIAQQMHGEKVTVAFKQKTINGVNVHYFAIPIITPAWAIKDGQWIVGLYPQVVVGAAESLGSKDRSILDNPAYVDLIKRLGNVQATSMQFSDLPKLAPSSYSSWLLITRYAGMGDLFGIDSPLMILPPMQRLQEHLSAAGSVSWTTDEGIFMRSISPFPGSETISADPLSSMGVMQPALMASILLPSLNKARETANRVKCAANLKQIGNGLILYANENKGAAPPDLGTLVVEDLTAQVFICPSGNTAPPDIETQSKPDLLTKWINANSDYVYIKPAGPLVNLGADVIVVYEKFEDHDNDGINILYADGHVEFMRAEDAHKEIDAQTKAAPKLKGGGL